MSENKLGLSPPVNRSFSSVGSVLYFSKKHFIALILLILHNHKRDGKSSIPCLPTSAPQQILYGNAESINGRYLAISTGFKGVRDTPEEVSGLLFLFLALSELEITHTNSYGQS